MGRKKETGKKEAEKKPFRGRVDIPEEEFEKLKEKAGQRDEYYNKWLKVHAEYENTRRRMEKEKTDHMRFANENIISQLFPIVDNFDMALAAMEKAEDKTAVMDGIGLVQKEFHRILEDNGVERIETEGKQFDPNVHEAVTVARTSEHPDGLILEEVRAGYMLNKRLLRPAQVRVVKNDSDLDKVNKVNKEEKNG
ncbi:MAG: nucleotide exchange factor GrpE [Candidatus Makaraimicrobium thalassicum]|nr:MAG: nucleotide exchange factor GrpE [Candidatus Omnitrophota bacterium]